MDPRQLSPDTDEVFRALLQADRAGLWTAMPGSVVSFDAEAVTVQVQLGLLGVVTDQTGRQSAVSIPVLPDVPVIFPGGGGATLTFPVAAGDEVLVVFASRAIDAWWQSGGVQLPFEPRLHDLSDGFAILKPMSQARKIAAISTSTVQLRSDDGEAFVELDPASHDINATTPGAITASAGGTATLRGAQIVLDGPVRITGPLQLDETLVAAGNATFNGPLIDGRTGKDVGGAHAHSNVTNGSHNSGGVA
jgi:hypothetical protein